MKFFKNKLAVTIIVLSVAFLGLIIYTINSDKKDMVSGGIGNVVSPVQKVVYKINDKIKSGVSFILNFSEVKTENDMLTKRNIELENKLLEYEKLEKENERLRQVLDFKNSRDSYDYLGCNIIGYSGGSITQGYIIDRGQNDGLQKGMVVIAAEGLVGQVTTVDSNWAIVQSLTNENIAVSVTDNNSRDSSGILRGYSEGKKESLTKVTNLPLDSEIKAGDVILTSGLGAVYPKDIRVGEVISVETDEVKVMKSAIVKPYVNFNKLEEVFAIIPKEKREIRYDNW